MYKLFLLLLIVYVSAFSHIPKNIKGKWTNKNNNIKFNIDDNKINIINDNIELNYFSYPSNIKFNISINKFVPRFNLGNTFRFTKLLQNINKNGITIDINKLNEELIIKWDTHDNGGNFTLYKSIN